MVIRLLFTVVVFFSLMTQVSFGQENIEKLYLRKAVKDFVGKKYDNAIDNLKQVLVANSENKKAKKLLVKCYVYKGNDNFSKNNTEKAKEFFNLALRYDSQYKEAIEGLKKVETYEQKQAKEKQYVSEMNQNPQKGSPSSTSQPQTLAQQQMPPQTAVQPNIIFATPPSGSLDTAGIEIIKGLFNNLSQQQEFIEKQMTNSKEALDHYEDSKEKYLNTLVEATSKNNDMMRKVLYIGGAVGLGVLVIIFIVFGFIFKSVTKSSDLRTVQANEAVMTLLSMQSVNKNGEEQLMLTGPSDSTDPSSIPQENQSDTQDPQNQSKTINSNPDDVNKMNKGEDSTNKNNTIQQINKIDAITTDIVDVKEERHSEKVKKLEELLRDDNNRVRANAAKVMYDIDNNLSIHTLKEMLENPSKRMRASAVWALGEIGSEEALNLILTIKDEEDEIVQYNIVNALGKVKSLEKFKISESQLSQINDIIKT